MPPCWSNTPHECCKPYALSTASAVLCRCAPHHRALAKERSLIRSARQGWDQLSVYLPVVLMAVLALGTWWLVRNAPKPALIVEARPAGHQPDYFMKSFSVKSFDAKGRSQSEVEGEQARHYPDTDTLEIDTVRVRSVRMDGSVTVATANRGLSNADGSEVQLFGNEVVTRDAQPVWIAVGVIHATTAGQIQVVFVLRLRDQHIERVIAAVQKNAYQCAVFAYGGLCCQRTTHQIKLRNERAGGATRQCGTEPAQEAAAVFACGM